MPVRILLDTPQKRIGIDSASGLSGESMSTLVTGYDWDLAASSVDLYVEPARGMLMCRPGFKYPDWLTSNTGIFAKLPLSSFTTTPSTGYLQTANNPDNAPFYRLPDNSSGDTFGVLTYDLAENQPVVCEWWNPQTTANSDACIFFGWGDPISPIPGDISAQLYLDGRAAIAKCFTSGYENVGVGYTFSGQKNDRFNRNDSRQGAAVPNRHAGVAIIPCCGRELVVISSEGGSFTHVFDDIPEGTDGTITPARPFWWFVGSPTTAEVRVSLCRFSNGGIAYGTLSRWRTDVPAIPTGGWQYWIDADSTGGTVSASVADGLTPTSAYDNNANGVRVAATLIGTGPSTPFVFGVRAYSEQQLTSTAGPSGGFDITAWTKSFKLTGTDTTEGGAGSITFLDLQAIQAAGASTGLVQNLSTGEAIPIQIWIDDVLCFHGILRLPVNKTGIVYLDHGKQSYQGIDKDGNPSNKNEEVTFQLRDLSYFLEEYFYGDPIPFDGQTLQDAYIQAAQIGGADPEVGITVSAFSGFTLDHTGNVTNGEYNFMARAGDKCLVTLDRMVKSFAADSFHGYHPSLGLQCLAPADLGSDPVLTMYDCAETAAAFGSYDPALLFRLEDIQILSLMANDIYIMGLDVRSQRPIIIRKADALSADPTITPAERPSNWLGHIRKFGQIEPRITSVESGSAAIQLLYKRMTPKRGLVQINVQYNPLMQRASVLRLEFMKSGLPSALAQFSAPGIIGTSIVARIKTFDGVCTQFGNPDSQTGQTPTRQMRTTCVLQILDGLSDAALLHLGGRSAHAMQAEWGHQIARNQTAFHQDFIREIHKRPPILWAAA